MRVAIIGLSTAAAILAASYEPVPFPAGFREWVHVKSALITPRRVPDRGDLHHIYANPEAVQGYRTGVFDEHAIIAYELLETREASGVVSWGFERFLGDSQTNRAVSDQGAKCFACHEKQKTRGYVFSRIRQ
jgi:Cytochrome P460